MCCNIPATLHDCKLHGNCENGYRKSVTPNTIFTLISVFQYVCVWSIVDRVLANDDAWMVYISVCRRVRGVKRCVFACHVPVGLGVEWEGYLRRWQRLEGVLQSPVWLEQQAWEQEQEKRRSCPGEITQEMKMKY